MKIPFHRPYITDDDVEAVVRTLRSGWTTMGVVTRDFETRFGGYVGAKHAVALNSCTAALHLAYIAAGVGAGDEVIMPAVNFAAAAEAACYLGARPVFTDVDRDAHLMDPHDLERKITPRTKAVVPVHYAGVPCDMDRISSITKGKGITLIEDAAHSLPSRYKGRMVGSIGDITCFSFYVTKTLSTGEGGMAVTDNDAWADRMRVLRLHGISRDAWKRYLDGGSWRYDVLEPGYKYNPTDIASSLGITQLAKLEEMWRSRVRIAAAYDEAFNSNDAFHPYSIPENTVSAWHLYPLRVNTDVLTIDRDRFIDELAGRGIATSVHFIPLYHFTAYKGLGYDPSGFPGAEWVFQRVISLPIYPAMTDTEIDWVIENCAAVAARYRR